MIFGIYKLHKATSDTMSIFNLMKAKETIETVRRRTLRETLSRTSSVRMSPALSRACTPNNPNLNRVDTSFGAMQERSPVEAGDRAGVTRTTTTLHWSHHRITETSFAVCHGSELVRAPAPKRGLKI